MVMALSWLQPGAGRSRVKAESSRIARIEKQYAPRSRGVESLASGWREMRLRGGSVTTPSLH